MPLTPFQLERYFARYEFQAPHLLCSSDCESLSLHELMNLEPEAQESLEALSLGYTESQGHRELRAEIARHYQQIDAAHVLAHTGAEEAIFTFMSALLEPGDHIVVQTPCYQSLAEIARSIGCEVTAWQTREQEGWALDVEVLQRQIRASTKAVVVNCPHNPTGYVMDRQTQRDIIEIARRHGCLLFSDEVYRGLDYAEHDQLPAACDLYERAVSLGVMSKAYGLAGLRVGWIATQDRDIYARMAVYKDYLSICNSAPSELQASVALRHQRLLLHRNVRSWWRIWPFSPSSSPAIPMCLPGSRRKLGRLPFRACCSSRRANPFALVWYRSKGYFSCLGARMVTTRSISESVLVEKICRSVWSDLRRMCGTRSSRRCQEWKEMTRFTAVVPVVPGK